METAHLHSVFPMVFMLSDPAISRSTCARIATAHSLGRTVVSWDTEDIKSPLLLHVLSLIPPMQLQNLSLTSLASIALSNEGNLR